MPLGGRTGQFLGGRCLSVSIPPIKTSREFRRGGNRILYLKEPAGLGWFVFGAGLGAWWWLGASLQLQRPLWPAGYLQPSCASPLLPCYATLALYSCANLAFFYLLPTVGSGVPCVADSRHSFLITTWQAAFSPHTRAISLLPDALFGIWQTILTVLPPTYCLPQLCGQCVCEPSSFHSPSTTL